MNSREFSKVRHSLSRTQNQMAQLLCVSVKAVQSYEQGWRNIPLYIKRQLLLLISLKKTPNRKIKPCWDLKDCAPEWIVK
ncbi:MAG: helix-turn-helix domain-containing protein [Nitrososphaeraceae archaeon]